MSGPIIGLGIDPGLRSTGIAAVERWPNGAYRSRGVKVSRTEPTKDKSFSRMRTSNDDQRRVREHWVNIKNAIDTIQPNVIGIENYLVFEPQDVGKMREDVGAVLGLFGGSVRSLDPQAVGRWLADPVNLMRFIGVLAMLEDSLQKNARNGIGMGQAAKTIAVYGVTLGAAFTAGVPVFVFAPYELKQRFGGRKGASKDEVGLGLERLVQDLPAQMQEKVPQKTMKEHAWDATGHAILATDEYFQLRLDSHST